MRGFLILVLVHISLFVSGQDTLFIRTLQLDDRAINLDSDGLRMLIRLKNRVLLYSNDKLEPLDQPCQKTFSWLGKRLNNNSISVYHTDFLPPEKIIKKEQFENLLPGFPTNHMSAARINNSYFVCYRGAVLEYRIDPFVQLRHKGISIRHVLCNDSLRFISTYSGIFLDRIIDSDTYSTVPVSGTYYSNGETSVVDERYYLCQDGLYLFEGDSVLRRVSSEVENKAFRKLLKWNGKTVSLFADQVSEFDLGARKIIRTLLSGREFSDAELYGDTLLCCDRTGNFYKVRPDGKTDTISHLGPLYDIAVSGGIATLSGDSGLYSYTSQKGVTPLKKGIAAIQAVSNGPYLFFTNFEGLYLLLDDTVFTLVGNIEFNKKALSLHNNYLYAGSIDGLYTIQLSSFESNILPGLKPLNIRVEEPETQYWKGATVVLMLVFAAGAAAVLYRRKSRPEQGQVNIAPVISPEVLAALIRDNPELITVQSLAEKLGTSVVQLNRKMKPFGETPLTVMQKTKKEIAIDMSGKGESLDQIARRTGYSKRYVREHFLS